MCDIYVPFELKLECCGNKFVKIPNTICHNNSSIENIFYTRRQTDGQTESLTDMKQVVAVRYSFTKTPKH